MHTIRLRGPWYYEVLARFVFSKEQGPGIIELPWDDSSRSERVIMPCDWSASLRADFRGRVRYRRRFASPTGLAPGDSVQLVFDQVTSLGEVRLNDHDLGVVTLSNVPCVFDITDRLQRSNGLAVVVEHPVWSDCDSESDRLAVGTAGGLTGEVRLMIS